MYLQDGAHGGRDPGASKNGNIEKIYTLEASLYVNDRLNQLGIKSDVTRTGDVTLKNEDRTDIVSRYEYCISHHFNAGGGDGIELIHSIYANGQFEHLVIDAFKDACYPIRQKPVYFRKLRSGQDYYYMHRNTRKCVTTIIEYDFVDGPQSEKIKDKNYRIGMYECLIKAICNRHKIEYKKVIEDDESLYKVQVGAYSVKDNADKKLNELKKQGIDAFIKKE